MALGFAQKTYKCIEEDWMGPENVATSAADGVSWFYTSDAGTAPAITATAAGNILRTTQSASAGNMQEVCFKDLAFTVQNGELMLETRIRTSLIASLAINVGFNDDVLEASNTLPAELSGTTWTTNAATFAGVAYDTDATNHDFHVMWVNGDTDSTEAIADLRMSGMAPVIDQWFGVNVRLTDRGAGRGARMTVEMVEESTGKHFKKSFDTNVARDTALTVYIGTESRGTGAPVWDVDYIYVRQSRGA